MAGAIIRYNADTGSNTLTSGGGPDIPVTGTNGDLAGSTLTLNGTFDFTGAANDGTDVCWHEGNANDRHLYGIVSFTGGVSTCTHLVLDRSYINRAGKSWAVGGVRKSFYEEPSRTDWEDAAAGWTYELQGAGTEYPVTASIPIPSGSLADGPVTVRAATGATPTLTWSSDAELFDINSNDYLVLEGITFVNSVSTSNSANAVDVNGGMLTATDCTFRSSKPVDINGSSTRVTMTGCDIEGTNQYGIEITSGSHVVLTDCVIHDCVSRGLSNHSSGGSLNISGCKFINNGLEGVFIEAHTSAHMVDIANTTFYNNTGGDILLGGTANVADGPYTFYNNIYSESGGYGFASDDVNYLTIFSDFNAYYSHTSGEVNNVLKGEHSVTLGADPFVSAATGDFTLNEVGNGGALCRDTAYYYGKDVVWGPTERPGKPVIKYNADSGSDTLASGAGPDVAVTGTNGEILTSNTVDLHGTFDLTGVGDDGTDVFWFDSTSGRKRLYPIESFTGGVSTCTGLAFGDFSGTAEAGRDWAIGGVRKTLTSNARTDPRDSGAGWTLELQDSTAEYVLTSACITFTGDLVQGPVTIRAASGATPVVSWTSNTFAFQSSSYLVLENLTITNTTSISTFANAVLVASGKFARMLGCTMDSQRAVSINDGRAVLIDCDVTAGDFGLLSAKNTNQITVIGSGMHDCGSAGLYMQDDWDGSFSAWSSVFENNANRGLILGVNGSLVKSVSVRNCVFNGNTLAGFEFFKTVAITSGPVVLTNNVFSGNSTYGIKVGQSTSVDLITYNNNNAYFNNTSGEVSTDITKGTNSITCITVVVRLT